MQLRRQQEPYNSYCEAAELSCSQQFSLHHFIKISFSALQHNFCLRQWAWIQSEKSLQAAVESSASSGGQIAINTPAAPCCG